MTHRTVNTAAQNPLPVNLTTFELANELRDLLTIVDAVLFHAEDLGCKVSVSREEAGLIALRLYPELGDLMPKALAQA